MIPKIAPKVLANAKAVWEETIALYGRDVVLKNADESVQVTVKAFVKRPKITGFFDRTHDSYDQEKYMLLVNASDFPVGGESPQKFMRAYWDGEDHIFISVTEVDLLGTVFGYRLLVKG